MRSNLQGTLARIEVGVANVAAFLDRLPTPPAYVTEGEAGAGFVELANRVLAARRLVLGRVG